MPASTLVSAAALVAWDDENHRGAWAQSTRRGDLLQLEPEPGEEPMLARKEWELGPQSQPWKRGTAADSLRPRGMGRHGPETTCSLFQRSREWARTLLLSGPHSAEAALRWRRSSPCARGALWWPSQPPPSLRILLWHHQYCAAPAPACLPPAAQCLVPRRTWPCECRQTAPPPPAPSELPPPSWPAPQTLALLQLPLLPQPAPFFAGPLAPVSPPRLPPGVCGRPRERQGRLCLLGQFRGLPLLLLHSSPRPPRRHSPPALFLLWAHCPWVTALGP
mmetsp:Transcript_30626/g.88994  ORF Transcript_30626/g.88994 Transcript_30626/m.88994 type:complete len:277 (-) Transcript_30626:250-1080(-)